MGFRRKANHHDHWSALIQQHRALLTDLPEAAWVSEAAFRDYLTSGAQLAPSVFELSPAALDGLWTFIHHAQFDLDATRFDHFNLAFSRKSPDTRK